MAKLHVYTGRSIEVTWDQHRCIHVAACLRANPAVFDNSRKPWVMPDADDVEKVVEAVERCPSGALQYKRLDGGAAEAPIPVTVLQVMRAGPYHLRGDVTVKLADGTTRPELRASLCRCGESRTKPYCDNSHRRSGFADPGRVEGGELAEPTPGACVAEAEVNGPFHVTGPLVVVDADGRPARVENETWLCRCGRSATKPFCDGSHETCGFRDP